MLCPPCLVAMLGLVRWGLVNDWDPLEDDHEYNSSIMNYVSKASSYVPG